MFVGLHVPKNFQMYRQNSENTLWGAIAPPPPPPATLVILTSGDAIRRIFLFLLIMMLDSIKGREPYQRMKERAQDRQGWSDYQI